MIKEVKIRNFIRIHEEITINMAPLNVLVGENGAGKSSILKAIHWASRCATLRDTKGKVTLEQMDYVPSKDFLDLGHKLKLQNSAQGRKTTVSLITIDNNKTKIEISAARNDAGVKVEIEGSLTQAVTNNEKPSTAYIPGLSGMAEEESILAVPVLHRKAATGESGSALRQILLQYSVGSDGTNGEYHELKELSEWVGKVLPGSKFWIKFDRLRDKNIDVKFLTPDMKVAGQADNVAWKSIDMAGTGFLQVVQIFTYLLYFQPLLLLIDEPDAHLHPTRQKTLMLALEEASVQYPDTQIIISTHSPNLVRALPNSANITWISDGVPKAHGAEVKERMGWNALDKEIIIFTEDGNTQYLENILAQWPIIQSKCLIWPTFGKDGLPDGRKCKELSKRMNVKILIHRDRDFMSDMDVTDWAELKQYHNNNIMYWVPAGSDIESLFLDPLHISTKLEIDLEVCQELFKHAFDCFDEDEAIKNFEYAYTSAVNKLKDRSAVIRLKEMGGYTTSIIKGKDFLKKIKRSCVDVLPQYGLGRSIGKQNNIVLGNPENPLAPDLHDKICSLLN